MSATVLMEQLDLFVRHQPMMIHLTEAQRTALIEQLAALLLAVVSAAVTPLAAEVNHAG